MVLELARQDLPETQKKIVGIALNDTEMSEQLLAQLHCFGYQGYAVSNTHAFKGLILHQALDVLVVDVDFCHRNKQGIALLLALKQQNIRPIPVIYVSKQSDLATRLACARADGMAFLQSPPEIARVIEHIEASTATETTEPYRILLVEDSKAQAFFLSTILRDAGMVVQALSEPLQLIEALTQFRPELVLMDIYLPNCNGLELAQVIRQQAMYVSVPIVFLSSEQNLHRQLSALTAGGDDFLTKPIEPEHLVSAIDHRVKRSRVLRSFMIRDSLTGLLNHTHLLERCEIEMARANREQSPLCFAMIDIDTFKSINDAYGHIIGDNVIKSIARLLKQRLRRTDVIGRYGGEEFAVVLPHTELEQAGQLLDEIRQTFGQIDHCAGKHVFHASFSAGVAHYEGGVISLLCEHADTALYQAKRQGRNRVVNWPSHLRYS